MKAFTGPNVISRAVSDDAAEDHRDDVPLAFWDRAGRRTIGRLARAGRDRPGRRLRDRRHGAAGGRAGRPDGARPRHRAVRAAPGQASAQAVARGVGNIDLRSGDLTDLDLPDGRFDAVVCPFAIFFASDMAAQVRRLWRLVRPGGQLALTTWGPWRSSPPLRDGARRSGGSAPT